MSGGGATAGKGLGCGTEEASVGDRSLNDCSRDRPCRGSPRVGLGEDDGGGHGGHEQIEERVVGRRGCCTGRVLPQTQLVEMPVAAAVRVDRDVARQNCAVGATLADVGQGEQSWVVLADPEGNEFCILGSRKQST